MAMKMSEIYDLTARPSHEEMRMVYDSIILPIVLAVVRHNQQELHKKARSLRSLFVRTADIIIARIEADLALSRRFILSRNIAINEEKNNSTSVNYLVTYRSYEESLAFSRDYLLLEINERIAAYMAEIFRKEYQHKKSPN